MSNSEEKSKQSEVKYSGADFLRDLKEASKKAGLPSQVKLIQPKQTDEFQVIMRPVAGIARQIKQQAEVQDKKSNN